MEVTTGLLGVSHLLIVTCVSLLMYSSGDVFRLGCIDGVCHVTVAINLPIPLSR